MQLYGILPYSLAPVAVQTSDPSIQTVDFRVPVTLSNTGESLVDWNILGTKFSPLRGRWTMPSSRVSHARVTVAPSTRPLYFRQDSSGSIRILANLPTGPSKALRTASRATAVSEAIACNVSIGRDRAVTTTATVGAHRGIEGL